MIVKNEENFLEGCLDSVKGLVDEIVIVDTGSEDSTLQIAEKHKARIFYYEWQNDFADARNFALSKSTGDWIIYLDADERVPEKYHKEILKLINNNKYDALVVKIRSEVNGPLGHVPHFQNYPRIFRNIPGLKFVYPIHEQIFPSLAEMKARTVLTSIVIEHLGYAQSEEIIKSKIERNKLFLENQIAADPQNAYALYQLAQTLKLMEDQEEKSAELYHRATELAGHQRGIAASSYLQLASMALEKDEPEEALQYVNLSLESSSVQVYGYFMKAEILFQLKKFRDALGMYEKVLNILQIPVHQRPTELMIEKDISIQTVMRRIIACELKSATPDEALDRLMRFRDDIEAGELLWLNILSVLLRDFNVTSYILEELFLQIVNKVKDAEELQTVSEYLVLVDKWFNFVKVRDWAAQNLKEIPEVNDNIFFLLAQAYFNGGDLANCMEYLSLYENGAGENELSLELKGTVLIRQGDFDSAIIIYERLIENNNNPRYLKILGGLYAKTGNMEKAGVIAAALNSI